MKVGGLTIWKELTIGVQQLVRLLLTIILSTLEWTCPLKIGKGNKKLVEEEANRKFST